MTVARFTIPSVPIVVHPLLRGDDFFMLDDRGPIYASAGAMMLLGILYLGGDWPGALRDFMAADED